MSAILTITDAVVASLNASGLLGESQAMRRFLPVYELKQMDALHVTVVPRSVERELADRTRTRLEVSVDVAVQKRLAGRGVEAEEAEIAELLTLAEQIAGYFHSQRVLPLAQAEPPTGALWLRTAHEPVYAAEHLEQLRQFTSVITLTFRTAG